MGHAQRTHGRRLSGVRAVVGRIPQRRLVAADRHGHGSGGQRLLRLRRTDRRMGLSAARDASDARHLAVRLGGVVHAGVGDHGGPRRCCRVRRPRGPRTLARTRHGGLVLARVHRADGPGRAVPAGCRDGAAGHHGSAVAGGPSVARCRSSRRGDVDQGVAGGPPGGRGHRRPSPSRRDRRRRRRQRRDTRRGPPDGRRGLRLRVRQRPDRSRTAGRIARQHLLSVGRDARRSLADLLRPRPADVRGVGPPPSTR
ncbi:hypothetical protein QE377_000540 [Microbacterium sp. SORGH_AS 862]|nr:hypothetical protein [Microbacterium sp. SORGH_AS_0862]